MPRFPRNASDLAEDTQRLHHWYEEPSNTSIKLILCFMLGGRWLSVTSLEFKSSTSTVFDKYPSIDFK